MTVGIRCKHFAKPHSGMKQNVKKGSDKVAGGIRGCEQSRCLFSRKKPVSDVVGIEKLDLPHGEKR